MTRLPRNAMLLAVGLGALILPSDGVCADASSAPPIECRWTDHPPVIDGKLDDPAWQRGVVVEKFIQPWLAGSPAARESTSVRMLWDREWLYFSAEMRDGDVTVTVEEHDGPMWENDVFELFLRPSLKHAGYFEFEVNPKGAVVDAFFRTAESYRNPGELRRDRFRVEAKVSVHGTLNQPDDRDAGWAVEGRIPWSDFNRAGGRPVPGESWRVNLTRVNGPAPNSELSSVAPLTEPRFHRTEEFVPLLFIGPEIKNWSGWKNERLLGTPEGPPNYVVRRELEKFAPASLVTVEPSPDREWFWFVQQTPYREGPTKLGRVRANSDGGSIEQLLEGDEIIYNIAFHPRFGENGFVYLGTNGPVSKGPRFSRVVRYTVHEGRPDPDSRTLILEWSSDGHNGAALAFADDGLLFVTSGDGSGDSDSLRAGQDPARLLSKVLRIDVDHPSEGKGYSIPKDNPFLDDARFAPETWAFGLRNPWRLTFDAKSQQLWVAENGQDLWEFARLVKRGANFGWSRYEGSHAFRPNEALARDPVTLPTIEHGHSEFRSLTGGVVYRGRAFPELAGAYVYADWGTGRIWAAKHDGSRMEWHRELCDTPLAISQIVADSGGELLVVDYGVGSGGAVYRLHRAEPQAATPPFPGTLQETGLFSTLSPLKAASGVLAYDIAAPAWHDGAVAEYHLALPTAGAVEIRGSKSWQAPDGTVLAQTLTHDERKIETRVLVKQQNDWAGYTYVWNEGQTDALLAPKEGADVELVNRQPWRVPSRAECLMCHSRQANFALTLHDAQLNHGDQLQRWERAGLLTSNPVAFTRERAQMAQRSGVSGPEPDQRATPASPLLPSDPQNLARFVSANDSNAGLEHRARSYLGANCAHCHTLYGGGNSAMDFDWLVPLKRIDAINREPQHGTFELTDARVIAPGAAARSVLAPRVSRRGPGQMPPIGSRVADPDGTRLLVEWIESLRE